MPNEPGVAVDTVTGQLCRTWDWNYTANPNAKSMNTIPTCLSIFQDTPSETTSREDYIFDPATNTIVPLAEWIKRNNPVPKPAQK
jgi:hypothetical protein